MKKTKPSGPWRPFRNISSADRYWLAVGKLAKAAATLGAIDCLCFWIYYKGTWQHDDGVRIAAVCGTLLFLLHWRFFLRYLIRGFFACKDCRRLKTSRHISLVNLRNEGDCDSCADFERYMQERVVAHTVGAKVPFGGGDPTCRRVVPVEVRRTAPMLHGFGG